jgi:hypothetical protein
MSKNQRATAPAVKPVVMPDDITRFVDFIVEREAIRKRKEAGKSWPYTDDPILREYRFCNIHREQDRTTKWIATNWRKPHADDPNLWFAMAVARFVNWPPTLTELGFPVPWQPDQFLDVMEKRKRRGQKLEGDAYMIRANPKAPGQPKAIYIATSVLTPLWKAHESLRPRKGDTLRDWHDHLSRHHGIGSGFMGGQIVADIKYVEPLRNAPDWWTWAVSGPGSHRGLNRLLGRPVDADWSEGHWRRELSYLHEDIAPELNDLGIGRLCAQGAQHLCCEWDKFERARLGQTHGLRRYAPPRASLFGEEN